MPLPVGLRFALRIETPLDSVRLRHLVVYMGLEVGGCSLFADPSGYVGRIISTAKIILYEEVI